MGVKRLAPIGVGAVEGAARLIEKPKLSPPAVDAHKYTRGLCAIVGGEMPGAGVLAAKSAQHSGAGYVKLLTDTQPSALPADLVCETEPLVNALADRRIAALLVGPGLGRDAVAKERLLAALATGKPTVIDADGLALLSSEMLAGGTPMLATPHDGELDALCRAFSVIAEGRRNRALALAKASGMVICAKGPDTVIAAPDGRIALARPASSWLSVAGTGDVLAGIAASRMSAGRDPFTAAWEAVWLHGEAARLCSPAFTAEQLAEAVQGAMAAFL